MEPRLAWTVTGVGDDGNEYTIHGYRQMKQLAGKWMEEKLVSIILTEDGDELYCESEKPLVFWDPRTGMKIRCPDLEQ